MASVLTAISPVLEQACIWGGDWNVPLTGSLAGSTRAARAAVVRVLDSASLQVPTAELPAAVDGLASIDHLAVPGSWRVDDRGSIVVSRRLSDHSAYWITVSRDGAVAVTH